MTDYNSAALERAVTDDCTDFEPRDVRALTRCLTALPRGGDIYEVVSDSGNSYRVDAREGRCTCPDHQYRGVECLHIRRVAFATGEKSVPAWVDLDAVDSLLGEHVEGGPRVVRPCAATDGGVETAAESEPPADGDGRPNDCDCGGWNQGLELPCWPCYRDGFEEPASGDGDEGDDTDDGDDEWTREAPSRHEPADLGGGETTGVQDL